MSEKKRQAVFAAAPLRRRSNEDGTPSRTIEGVAIVFDRETELYSDEDMEVRESISRDAVTQQLLDGSDIKMTMFHNRELILARSNRGSGTLAYQIKEDGVHFSFEAPHTADGDKALELVGRGDLAGCSFAFWAPRGGVDTVRSNEGKRRVYTRTVTGIESIDDFTLAASPAYPQTSVGLRESLGIEPEPAADAAAVARQVAEMREAAK